ncbi:MAG: SDR family oxidoreductase [Myxococcota bacterium]
MTKILITGANRGIGLELARQLAARGDEVIAVCRQPSEELKVLDVRIEPGVDVTDETSVRKLAEKLGDERIDVLLLNAGILRRDGLSDLDLDAVRQQLEVNALGPLRMAAAFEDRLPQGGKIALITSRMGSIADNGSGGYYGYRMSKVALNMAGVSLARDLQSRGVAVGILHPGFVRTRMTDHQGNVDPADAAAQLIQRIDEISLDNTGSFRHANGETLPW